MLLTDDVQARCTAVFAGFLQAEDWPVKELHAKIGLNGKRSPTTLWRLLTGDARWDLPTVEATAQVVAGHLQVPVDDLLRHLAGGESDHALHYNQLALARLILPREKMLQNLGATLGKYEDSATDLFSFQRVLPLSQMDADVARIYHKTRLDPLGKNGRRILTQLCAHSDARRQKFLNCEGWAGRATLWLDIFESDLVQLRDGRGAYGGLSPERSAESFESLIHDSVEERDVVVGVIDDGPGRIPQHLLNFVAPYDAILMMDDKFVMTLKRGGCITSWCERKREDCDCNRHIAAVGAVLKELHRHVDHALDERSMMDRLRRFLP